MDLWGTVRKEGGGDDYSHKRGRGLNHFRSHIWKRSGPRLVVKKSN